MNSPSKHEIYEYVKKDGKKKVFPKSIGQTATYQSRHYVGLCSNLLGNAPFYTPVGCHSPRGHLIARIFRLHIWKHMPRYMKHLK